MVDFWKLAYEEVKEQRDQHKAENDILIDELTWYKAKVERLEREKTIKGNITTSVEIK